MILSSKNFKRTVSFLDKNKVIEIFCSKRLHNICELSILTQIFRKEALKYQIEFIPERKNTYFTIDGTEYNLIDNIEENGDTKQCKCNTKELETLFLLLSVIKSMNLVKVETIWPIIVSFTFYYKMYNGSSSCEKCEELLKSLILSVKTLNCKFDGIFYVNKCKLNFLQTSRLILAIKNDLDFVFEKKIFANSKVTEKKINEFLAKNGISILAANNQFIGLDLDTRNLINTTFGKEQKFLYKNGDDLEITALEHAFLMLFYIYKEKNMYSYMCLEKRKLIDSEKSCRFYHKAISYFKEGVLNSFLLDDLMIFKIKETGKNDENYFEIIFDILHPLFRQYLYKRNLKDTILLISFEFENSFMLLYSKDVDFDILKENKVYENCIKIDSKDFNYTMKMLFGNIN